MPSLHGGLFEVTLTIPLLSNVLPKTTDLLAKARANSSPYPALVSPSIRWYGANLNKQKESVLLHGKLEVLPSLNQGFQRTKTSAKECKIFVRISLTFSWNFAK